jgi:hypothetical protein
MTRLRYNSERTDDKSVDFLDVNIIWPKQSVLRGHCAIWNIGQGFTNIIPYNGFATMDVYVLVIMTGAGGARIWVFATRHRDQPGVVGRLSSRG